MRDPEKVKAARRRWYHRNKEKAKKAIYRRRKELLSWIKDYKASQKCLECGENHPATLVFHHRNPEEKEANIAHMVVKKGWGKERMMKEIEKCDVLCANCHRKIHYSE